MKGLYATITSSEFCYGVLYGESGSGKTSLLRAGIIPLLSDNGFRPLYIQHPTEDPHAAIHNAVDKMLSSDGVSKHNGEAGNLADLLRNPASDCQSTVIILDQFEEFFLLNRDSLLANVFVEWLNQYITDPQLPIALLICIRSDFLDRLRRLGKKNAIDLFPYNPSYELRNFRPDEARSILEEMAKQDKVPFETKLIGEVIIDLDREGFVRPPELQIVGAQLKKQQIFTHQSYKKVGDCKGILSSYISDVLEHPATDLKNTEDMQIAWRVLRLMCSEDGLTKAHADFSLEKIVQDSGVTRTQEATVSRVLNHLVEGRILICSNEGKYNLVHDYLAPSVRQATKGIATDSERAKRWLRFYLAQYEEDKNTRVPLANVLMIRRHAGADLKQNPKAEELLRRSMRQQYRLLFVSMSLISVLLASILYGWLYTSYYLSIEPNSLGTVTDIGFNSRPCIVVRSGHPAFKFVPGFNQNILQTDFAIDDLARRSSYDILREQVNWWQPLPFSVVKQFPAWDKALHPYLPISAQMQMIALLNSPEYGAEMLVQIIADSSANKDIRMQAAHAVSRVALLNPHIVTPEVLLQVVRLYIEEGEIGRPILAANGRRTESVLVVMRLAQANPQAMTEEVWRIIESLIVDPSVDYSVHKRTVDLAGQIAQVAPKSVPTDFIRTLITVTTDSSVHPQLQTNVMQLVRQLGQVKPQLITPNLLRIVLSIVSNPNITYPLKGEAVHTVGELAQANPLMVSPEIVDTFADIGEHFESIVSDQQVDIGIRKEAMRAILYLSRAYPEIVTEPMLEEVIALAMESDEVPGLVEDTGAIIVKPTLRMDDGYRDDIELAEIAAQLARINPQAVTQDILRPLTSIIADPTVDYLVHVRAVAILRELILAAPQSTPTDLVQNLIALISDENADTEVRRRAAAATEQIAQANPQAVMPDLLPMYLATFITADEKEIADIVSKETFNLLALVEPRLVTPELMNKFVTIMIDPESDSFRRYSAARSLGYLAQASPQSFNSEVLRPIVSIISNPNSDPIRSDQMWNAVQQILEIAPQSIPMDLQNYIVTSFIGTDGRSAGDYYTLQMIEQIAQGNPHVVTTELLQAVLSLIVDSSEQFRSDNEAVQILGQLSRANPNVVTSNVMEVLLGIIGDTSFGEDMRLHAAQNFGAISV